MKKGKELKINTFEKYNVYYGSVNNKEPKTLYINISAWAEPKVDDDVNYSRVIKDLDKIVRQFIYNEVDNTCPMFLKEKTIVDFDIKESGIKYGKKSFMNCEITLFMKHGLPINTEDVKLNLDNLINIIVDNIDKSKYFKFYKTKN